MNCILTENAVCFLINRKRLRGRQVERQCQACHVHWRGSYSRFTRKSFYKAWKHKMKPRFWSRSFRKVVLQSLWSESVCSAKEIYVLKMLDWYDLFLLFIADTFFEISRTCVNVKAKKCIGWYKVISWERMDEQAQLKLQTSLKMQNKVWGSWSHGRSVQIEK